MKMTDFYEDACYLSNSEPEADSDDDSGPIIPASSAQPDASGQPEEESWDDPQVLLNTWLGELDHLKEVSPFPPYYFFWYFFSIWMVSVFLR